MWEDSELAELKWQTIPQSMRFFTTTNGAAVVVYMNRAKDAKTGRVLYGVVIQYPNRRLNFPLGDAMKLKVALDDVYRFGREKEGL